MKLEIKTWLFDILNAIGEIESFTNFQDFASFHSDVKTKRAVERNIEIIGEAMSRILAKDDKIDLTNTRRIVDTRNASSMVMIQYRMKSYGILLCSIFLFLNKRFKNFLNNNAAKSSFAITLIG